jgi:hypothetical protein
VISTNPFVRTLREEINDLREQAVRMPSGKKRASALQRADTLEVTLKAHSWAASSGLQPPRPDNN